MALVRLDFLTSYLSDSAISGLTFGAAIQAAIAQLNGVLGTKSDKINHTFLQNFYKLYDIFSHVGETNVPTLIISIVVLVILLSSKFLIEARTIKRGIPFPTELIVLIVGTLLSHFCQFEKRWGVHVISDIPVGMPVPEIPRFDVMRYLIGEAFSIAIVAFTVTVSMGKLFAKKHSYRIDPNQELLALGLCNSISSFFDVFPTSTSLSRTLVNEASGAKTQISGLVSSLIILLVILLIGPSLEDLPMCILSCIVLVALRSLLMKITELPKLWRFSKLDVVIWVMTALVTILWDIMQGLLAGIIVALVLVVARTQWPRLHELGVVDELYSDFRDMNRYAKASPTRVPIVRFDAPLIFTNVDVFKKRMRQVVDRMDVKRESKDSWRELTKMQSWAPLILDCSTWIYTDSMGVEAIKDLNDEFLKCRVILLFANLRSSVRVQYYRAGLFASMCDGQFYPSIRDALLVAEKLRADSVAIPEDRTIEESPRIRVDGVGIGSNEIPYFTRFSAGRVLASSHPRTAAIDRGASRQVFHHHMEDHEDGVQCGEHYHAGRDSDGSESFMDPGTGPVQTRFDWLFALPRARLPMAAPPTARWMAAGRSNDGSELTSSSLSMISATSSGSRNEEEMLKLTDISLPLKKLP
ncbi:hypothetical protein WR25_14203 [Diploscapter pachys]|uniref:STAS domain-containing protein n=1 Tax=Diploscapter pachys TaxID=2018661 RepID=A0A2A2LZF6_9BILA|nr:hypothetical protein WR25_14203 [Diploscapter pachys]